MAGANNGSAETTEQKAARHRSPNYPSIGLRAAVGKVQALYKSGGLAPLTKITALRTMGFGKPDANAARVLSAVKSFGLVEETDDERLKLTQRGIDVAARQADDPVRAEALRSAVTGPSIYKELLTEFSLAGLPPDPALKSELIAAKKFNPNAVDGFVRDLRDSLDFAGLSDLSVLESSQEPSETMRQTEEEPKTLGATVVKELEQGRTLGDALVKAGEKVRGTTPLLTQTLVISIPREFKVEIGVRGDELKKGDLARIKSQFNRWIEGLEEAFEE